MFHMKNAVLRWFLAFVLGWLASWGPGRSSNANMLTPRDTFQMIGRTSKPSLPTIKNWESYANPFFYTKFHMTSPIFHHKKISGARSVAGQKWWFFLDETLLKSQNIIFSNWRSSRLMRCWVLTTPLTPKTSQRAEKRWWTWDINGLLSGFLYNCIISRWK